jgi:hypothetical protein
MIPGDFCVSSSHAFFRAELSLVPGKIFLGSDADCFYTGQPPAMHFFWLVFSVVPKNIKGFA